MSISEELRAAGNRLFLRESDGYGTIMSLADRIDNEMAELPNDATGKPIHIGDTVYGKDGRAYRVCGADIDETSEDSRYFIRVTNVLNVRILFKPECLTHELPDSLERIADELDEQAGSLTKDGYTWQEDAIHDFADRIRKLAAKEQGDE